MICFPGPPTSFSTVMVDLPTGFDKNASRHAYVAWRSKKNSLALGWAHLLFFAFLSKVLISRNLQPRIELIEEISPGDYCNQSRLRHSFFRLSWVL